VLYLSWHFVHTPLEADWLENDNIPRRDAAHMTLQQFQEEFEVPNRPVIITGEVRLCCRAVDMLHTMKMLLRLLGQRQMKHMHGGMFWWPEPVV
jgi:hypothetical protein